MLPYYTEIYGNASSFHQFGQQARKAVEEAREKVADFIGADAGEIFFTSGGTEADNFAIKGIAYANQAQGKHIITSQIEHLAVLNPCKYLEKQGFRITYLPVDKHGLINPEEVRKAITDETILISIMQANNETGTIEPIAEIGKIAKEKAIYFHTDAVQSAGKIPVKVKELNVHLVSLSGHKLYGPNGMGALYIAKGTRIQPLMLGGHHEKNKRAGTENVPGIVGLAKAVEIAQITGEEEAVRLTNLRNKLESLIREKIEDVFLHGHEQERLPNTLNISFEGVEGESIILGLDREGIAISSGSACTSGTLEPSHVLKAMGIEPLIAQGSIRFSLGKDNNMEDIDYVVEILPGIVARLREISPFYKKKKK